MSKKIIISFSAEPTVGVGFTYTIKIGGVDLIYANGLSQLNLVYQAFGGTDPTKVAIQGNFNLTIKATLAFLNANFSSSAITYARVNNTIEATINTTISTVVYVTAVNPNIAVTSTDISNITTVGLKYSFEYMNIVNDTYLCQIFKKNYTGTSQQINGIAILEKASVNNHLDPIIGGGMTIELEANKDLTLQDLYSENEKDFSVKLYKNNTLVFQGFLNPDGVYQDYVRDAWKITLDCVDGLGAISNLSFVQDNGLHFTGKMKAIDIIYQCLKRTGILMPINTSINILYDGLTDSDDILRSIYLNADRFIKTDNDTIMSCEEVLKSILDIFKACITQIDAEWYIYKPNEIFVDPNVVFRRFDITNNYIGNKTVKLGKNLGSQIDGFYPHHCTGNQRIEIKGSVGGFRINYKYGFVSGLLENGKLAHNSFLNYDGWTINTTASSYLINDPLDNSGFLMKPNLGFSNLLLATADLISLNEGDTFKLKTSIKANGNAFFTATVRAGSYFLNGAGQWVTSGIGNITFAINANASNTVNANFELTSLPLPISSNIEVKLFVFAPPVSGVNKATSGEWVSFDLEPTNTASNIVGEFHTVERSSKVSSIVKPNQTVYNGDNNGIVYLGAIFDENQNPTTLWNRKNSLDLFPLLRIAAEEEMRISQRPTKIFRGDIYGYIPYLSLIHINNVGYFMPIEWSYNTATNITTCKQLELFAAELSDIVYKYTLDYGNVVKPTIQ